jgi:hypothetical protein
VIKESDSQKFSSELYTDIDTSNRQYYKSEVFSPKSQKSPRLFQTYKKISKKTLLDASGNGIGSDTETKVSN